MTKEFLTSEEIINYIASSKKTTPVKVYIKGDLAGVSYPDTPARSLEMARLLPYLQTLIALTSS